MAESKQRIYLVAPKAGVDEPRLVRAATNISAMRHVAEQRFDVRIPTQDELVALASKGVKVETANEAVNQQSLPIGEPQP